MPSFLGALAGAALPFVGKLVGKAADVFLGRESLEDQMHASREAMQHGISWRVDDAKRAGVHPLYALGANLPSFNPVGVGETGEPFSSIAGELGQSVRNRGIAADERSILNTQKQLLERDLSIRSSEAQIASMEVNIARKRHDEIMFKSNEGNGVPGLARPGYPYIQGDIQPGLSEFAFKGFPLLLPSVQKGSGSAEALESMEKHSTQLFILEQNLAHYGEEGVMAARRAMGERTWNRYFAEAWHDVKSGQWLVPPGFRQAFQAGSRMFGH